MKLSELIAAYGDDIVQFQSLDQCADALNMSKGVTKITFGTPQALGPNGMEKLGLVVWMDRNRVEAIITGKEPEADAMIRARAPSQDGGNHE